MIISKIIQVIYGRQKGAVETQKMICGGRKIENLIESTCFYLEYSQVHMFCSSFSQVNVFAITIFWNQYQSIQIPGFPELYIVKQPAQKNKN